MKRIRRVTVEISHHSVTITRIETPTPGKASPLTAPECDICGAPCVLVTRDPDRDRDTSFLQIRAALLKRGMHAHFSVAGQLWVCSQSLQNLSENP